MLYNTFWIYFKLQLGLGSWIKVKRKEKIKRKKKKEKGKKEKKHLHSKSAFKNISTWTLHLENLALKNLAFMTVQFK